MVAYGLFAAVVIIPLALIFLRTPPETPTAAGAAGAAGETPQRVRLAAERGVRAARDRASFLCCVTMSMPQSHLVAFCTDLGYSAQSGAAMLSVLLGARRARPADLGRDLRPHRRRCRRC